MTDSILVIPDFTPDGALAVSTTELLGAAALVGTPVAVAPANADPAALASLGATQVFQGPTWATPADAAATARAVYAAAPPLALLAPHSPQGRDVVALVSVQLRLPVSTRATGLERDEQGVQAHHAAFGGTFTSVSAPTFGAPLITLQPGSIDHRAPAAKPNVTVLDVPGSAARLSITPRETAPESTDRPGLVGASTVVSGGLGAWLRGGFLTRYRACRCPRCRRRGLPRRRRRRLHRPHRPGRTDRRDRDPRPLYHARYLGRSPTPRRHADLQAHHHCE